MPQLPERLIRLCDTLTTWCRRDELPCPPVPPNRFHLRLVFHKLITVKRALERLHYFMLPVGGKTLPQQIYSAAVSIYWCICGPPPVRTVSYLHATEEILEHLVRVITRESSRSSTV